MIKQSFLLFLGACSLAASPLNAESASPAPADAAAKTRAKELAYLEKVAQAGDERAIVSLFYYYVNSFDEKNALVWMNKGIALEIPDILIFRAMAYAEGSPKDMPNARKMAERGLRGAKTRAVKGDPHHQMILGSLYQYGLNGVLPVDAKEALRWMRLAAAQGYEPAVQLLDDEDALTREQQDALRREDEKRARQFWKEHPEMSRGDGQTEKTPYEISGPRRDMLIQSFVNQVYPGSIEGPAIERATEGKTLYRQTLYTQEGRSIDVYFSWTGESER